MIETVAALINILGTIALIYHEIKLRDQKNLDDSLRALSEAIAETTKYLERENPKEHQRATELELSELWRQASISVRKISPDLAGKLRIKSTYWENSANLSRREIHQSGIALIQIKKDFESLFTKE